MSLSIGTNAFARREEGGEIERHRSTFPSLLAPFGPIPSLPPWCTLSFPFSHRISSDKEFGGSWNSSPFPPSLSPHISRRRDTSELERRKKKPTQSVSPLLCLPFGLARMMMTRKGEGKKEGRKCSTHERKCFEKGKGREGRKRATDREQIDLTRGSGFA